jgi:hypothetical protein
MSRLVSLYSEMKARTRAMASTLDGADFHVEVFALLLKVRDERVGYCNVW